MTQVRAHPRGLVRYLYDRRLDNHILLCETSVSISEGGRTRVEVMSGRAAASLCSTMVNTLFEAKGRGVDDIDNINLTLYQAREKWFGYYTPASTGSCQRSRAEINIAAFPDEWRGSKLSIETGMGGHCFKLLVHPDEPCTEKTSHGIDTRHKCSFQVRFSAVPVVCTDQDQSSHRLSLPGSPIIHLCHPWNGLGARRILPTTRCARWAELTSQALQSKTFRRDTLTALRFGRVWQDVQRTLEAESARSLKKMGLTCHEIRRFPIDDDQPNASASQILILRLPSLGNSSNRSVMSRN
jgi:hypothetical protein